MIPEHEVAELLKGTPYEGASILVMPWGSSANTAGQSVIDDALQNAARAIRAERELKAWEDVPDIIRAMRDRITGNHGSALVTRIALGKLLVEIDRHVNAKALLNDSESQPA